MKTQTHLDGDTLTVTRHYAADPTDVFDAWINAMKTTHWWGCGQTTQVSSTIDPVPGGPYQHLMHIDQVGDYLIDGTILEVVPPSKLVYQVPGFEDGQVMMVEVNFKREKDGTRVTLVQSPLPSDLHDTVAGGWTISFERLADYFSGYRRAA